MNQSSHKPIQITHVTQNNLCGITTEIPSRRLTVITGVSGSGKSSLAFETLYAEGQRRYIESLSTYTRQFLEKMPKPEVESIKNIPPSIALEQRNHIINSRSTVGTQTEVVDFLRLLFAKIGITYCVECESPVKKVDSELLLQESLNWFIGKKGGIGVSFSRLFSQSKNNTKSKANQKKIQSILKFLQEQGYHRIAGVLSKNKIIQIEVEELVANPKSSESVSIFKAIEKDRAFILVDRLKIKDGSQTSNETQTRILDSINQAISIGRGQLTFIDLDSATTRSFDCNFSCTKCGKIHDLPSPQLFSFNSPIGACANCSGFGYTLDLDENRIVPDPNKTLKNGAIDPLSKPSLTEWQNDLFRFAERQGISIGKRYRELTLKQKQLIWEGSSTDNTFPGIRGCFQQMARKKYKLHIRVFIRRYQSQKLCPVCEGSRLTPEATAVKIGKSSIADVLALPIIGALDWIQQSQKSKSNFKIAEEIFQQLERRLSLLNEVGVGYLTLSRLAKTLSGGEYQRINLASQLGSGLCGTLYVLDEPSIGLHAADTERLIKILLKLRDQGNTVVVVEHDLDVMKAADHLIELGPGAGAKGGRLVASGQLDEIEKNQNSLTAKYIKNQAIVNRNRTARSPAKKFLRITNCKENNLKNITVEIPLERFVVVTGVSGSGKSTLVHKTIYSALERIFFPDSKKADRSPGEFKNLYGAENIGDLVLLDQKPIGKSSRSNPATYMKAWDEFRRLYANQVLAIKRGYTPQSFSFNVEGGRCPVCKGEGEITLDMHFMAEVKLPCDECKGKRFKKNILDINCRGKNVDQLLRTTVDEAYNLFRDNSILNRKLGILRDVGLGYLQIGQAAPTLSGGECQRLKIAAKLDEKCTRNTLFVFDEPTTGLHQEDVHRLLEVLQDLVDAHHSILMIEHHLDVIAQSDWVIDLGPGGGEHGGDLIAACPPDQLHRFTDSTTGRILCDKAFEFPKRSELEKREISLQFS